MVVIENGSYVYLEVGTIPSTLCIDDHKTNGPLEEGIFVELEIVSMCIEIK